MRDRLEWTNLCVPVFSICFLIYPLDEYVKLLGCDPFARRHLGLVGVAKCPSGSATRYVNRAASENLEILSLLFV
jgi:hypothetical protein